MEHTEDVIRARRSVRTFDGKPLSPSDLESLSAFAEQIDNPYGIPVEFRFLDATKQKLPCPIVTGTNHFVGGKVRKVPHMEEAFGYTMETLVLYAQSLGIGSVWIGGTMDRPAFEQAMELTGEERMPCMSPLGYPAAKRSIKETMMRKAIHADSRELFTSLFFDGSFGKPLTREKACQLAVPLEMVRLAPSAVNRQPWRVVVTERAAHFYLKHTKGFVSQPVGDMQKIDVGIALCHFDLCAQERKIPAQFTVHNPGLQTDPDTEYIGSYLLS